MADPGLGPHDPFLLSRTGLPTPAHLLFHPGQDPMPSWQRGVRTTCIYLGGLSVLSHSTAGAQGQAGGPPVGGEQWVGGQQAWEGMGFENMLVSPRNTLWRPPPPPGLEKPTRTSELGKGLRPRVAAFPPGGADRPRTALPTQWGTQLGDGLWRDSMVPAKPWGRGPGWDVPPQASAPQFWGEETKTQKSAS